MIQTLFVACTPGLEPALAEELAELGFPGTAEAGGVTVTAPPQAYERINLWSRVASRVLLRVATVTSPRELGKVSLEAFGTRFEVDVVGEGTGPWKQAVSSAFPTGAGGFVQLRVQGGRCTVSVDTSGELLHVRGYRQEVGRAPLRETLAAGFLRLAGWKPGEPLWDLMCGSGTIVIEAAEWALGLAPGRARRFAFEAFAGHDAARFRSLAGAQAARSALILASDLNAGALGTARRNARRAGVLESLTLERCDATQLTPRPGPPGLVIANLPYGKRVGERSELGTLYRDVGHALRRALAGWRFAFFLTEGAEQLGLPITRRFAVRNGGLGCQIVLGHVEGP